MDSKVTLRMAEEDRDEERQPLNAMVAENLKNIIIRRIYKDVERNVGVQRKGGSPVVQQYLAALGPIIAALSSGMSAGYSAILLPQLMAADSEIMITKDEGSWIASMLALPLIFGCLVSGYLMDNLGRKMSQMLSCVPFTIGWVVLAFSPNVAALYVGRFITGFCVGLISPMCQVYIAETSQPESRGVLLSGAPLTVAIGIFISHILGTFFTWKVTAGICGIPPLACILLLLLAPESPSWLLQKNRLDAARKAFLHLRGDSEEATKEFNALLSNASPPRRDAPAAPKWRLCLNPSFLKPFLVLNFYFMVQQFSGVNAVAFYSVNILKSVLTTMDEYFATILIDIVRFAVSLLAIFLLKRLGRKTLSVLSAVGTALSLFALAAYLALAPAAPAAPDASLSLANLTAPNDTDLLPTTLLPLTTLLPPTTLLPNTTLPLTTPPDTLPLLLTYLPMLFLILYISFVSIGLVPIPWVLTGELFAKEMRGLGSGGTSSFGFLCYFVVVKLTPDLFDLLGTWGTFCLFGAVSLLGSLVLWLFLPETKDKTLTEIEAFYSPAPPPAPPSPHPNGGDSIHH